MAAGHVAFMAICAKLKVGETNIIGRPILSVNKGNKK